MQDVAKKHYAIILKIINSEIDTNLEAQVVLRQSAFSIVDEFCDNRDFQTVTCKDSGIYPVAYSGLSVLNDLEYTKDRFDEIMKNDDGTNHSKMKVKIKDDKKLQIKGETIHLQHFNFAIN